MAKKIKRVRIAHKKFENTNFSKVENLKEIHDCYLDESSFESAHLMYLLSTPL